MYNGGRPGAMTNKIKLITYINKEFNSIYGKGRRQQFSVTLFILKKGTQRKRPALTVLLCPYKYGIAQLSLSSSERCYPNMVLGKFLQVDELSFSQRYIDRHVF